MSCSSARTSSSPTTTFLCPSLTRSPAHHFQFRSSSPTKQLKNYSSKRFSEESQGSLLHEDFDRLDRQGIVSLLQADLSFPAAKRLHAHIAAAGRFDGDLYIWNHVVNMYAKCHALEDARLVFDNMQGRNVVSWNAMITAYSQHGHWEEALALFSEMKEQRMEPNKVTFMSILRAFCTPAAVAQGKLIESHIICRGLQSDIVVSNALISMYCRCGAVEDAGAVFDKMLEHDVVSWTAMIEAYSQHGQGEKAIDLYKEMQKHGISLDKISFISVIGACANTAGLEDGKAIHAQIADCGFEDDVFLRNALINMYGRCGALEDARSLFDETHKRTVVSWNAMITAYSQHERTKESLQLFKRMQQQGVKPTQITFTSLLSACTSPAALAEGKAIHACIVGNGFDSDVVVGSALVSAYGKCSALEDARSVFDIMHERNLCSWNAMMAAYCQHGDGKEALHFLKQMEREGVKPNEVTFVGLLSACSHSGLVDEGHDCFVSMLEKYHITPVLEHYSCMIDLLGRAGRLNEAQDVIYKMQLEPDVKMWTSLLRACKIHGDVMQGERAAKHLFKLDPENAAAVILLSNMYSLDAR